MGASGVFAALAVVVLVVAVIIPAGPMVITIPVAAIPGVVITMVVKPVGTATPVRGLAKIFVSSVFVVNAMVLVLVMIMAIDTRRRGVTRRVITVMAMGTVGWFVGVAVRLCGIAEGKAGNAEYQRSNSHSNRSHSEVLCCLQG